MVKTKIAAIAVHSNLAYSNINLSTALLTEMQNRTQEPVQALDKARMQASVMVTVPITKNMPLTIPGTAENILGAGSHSLITPQPMGMIYDRNDFQPPYGFPKDAKTGRIYDWNLKRNQAHTDTIPTTLKMHEHAYAGKIRSKVITCTVCNKGKLSRAPIGTVNTIPREPCYTQTWLDRWTSSAIKGRNIS